MVILDFPVIIRFSQMKCHSPVTQTPLHKHRSSVRDTLKSGRAANRHLRDRDDQQTIVILMDIYWDLKILKRVKQLIIDNNAIYHGI